MEGIKGFVQGFRDAINGVRDDKHRAEAANDDATSSGSASLQVGNEQYQIKDEKGAGRIAKPIPQNSPPTTPTTS
jgi:hypothetical protein